MPRERRRSGRRAIWTRCTSGSRSPSCILAHRRSERGREPDVDEQREQVGAPQDWLARASVASAVSGGRGGMRREPSRDASQEFDGRHVTTQVCVPHPAKEVHADPPRLASPTPRATPAVGTLGEIQSACPSCCRGLVNASSTLAATPAFRRLKVDVSAAHGAPRPLREYPDSCSAERIAVPVVFRQRTDKGDSATRCWCGTAVVFNAPRTFVHTALNEKRPKDTRTRSCCSARCPEDLAR